MKKTKEEIIEQLIQPHEVHFTQVAEKFGIYFICRSDVINLIQLYANDETASLRSEITQLRIENERHRSLDEICIHYSKEDKIRQQKEMVELGLWNAPVFEHDINLLLMVVKERGNELTQKDIEIAQLRSRLDECKRRAITGQRI